MSAKKSTLILFIISMLFFHNQAEDETCTMPDGYSMSICKRNHRCDYFQSQVIRHGRNPPQSLINDINLHVKSCSKPREVCCPDNVTIELTIGELNLNLEQIRKHPNYHLINSNACGNTVSDRIIGGETADLNEFPWAVLLGYKDHDSDKIEWNCGGNLINERYVLTAAHCIKKHLHIARLGEHTISTAPDCDFYESCVNTQDIIIEEKIKHSRYSTQTNQNDIALLKLASPADTTAYNVKTICLPTFEKVDIERVKHKNFTISGWGKSDNGKKSDVLLKSKVRLQDANQCAISLAKASRKLAVYEENICAGGYNKMHGCKGDSGGGLTTTAVIDRKSRTFLYGLLARGVQCNTQGVFPDVYMNIKKYLGWILDNMS